MTPSYYEWLKHVFDRPTTKIGWYFDVENAHFDADDIELSILIIHTLENCGKDLRAFSNSQINHGLQYIFNNTCSNIVFALISDDVPAEIRLRAIDSIKILYKDCFESRCAPVLGHINELGSNPINEICYMLWDVSPLSWWEEKRSPEREIFYNAVIDVLEEALSSNNPACVESALHGLGHIQSSCIERVTEVITNYLKKVSVSTQLTTYAKQAILGNVQ
jgi:hypothetical protein